jgi:hypothetical protein
VAIGDLFTRELKVVNVGLASFKESLDAVGATAVQVDWRPPLGVSEHAATIVAARSREIEEANAKALDVILRAAPALTGLARAIDVVPGMTPDTILHAGPPITWDRMCGPMRGAIIGGLIYEGRAATPDDAEELASSGGIHYSPCHEHSAVGPMAGIVTPSMPVFIVRNTEFGGDAYCTMNEGLGKVLRYGAFSDEVIERLRWMDATLFPALAAAVEGTGPIDLKSIIAQALHMGDEVHNRNRAATSLFYRAVAPAVVEACDDRNDAARVLSFINGNDHFFLNLSMAASKATLDPARGTAASSVVIAMTRNGTDFGLQLAGTEEDWFTGPADVPDALFFPGYTREDANPDIGDSSITETAGLGGFAIAASPAIVQFVGGTTSDAIEYTLAMYEITAAENNAYQIPYLDFRGTPTGIDVVRVVRKNVLPFIDTGVAHREPGVGQVGAGVLNAPAEPFVRAFEGLARRLGQA